MGAKLSIAGFALLVSVAPLLAHHSAAAVYAMDAAVTVSGQVSGVEWLNPHARFDLDVKNPDGTVSRWEMELPSPNAFMREGIKKDFMKQGDQVSVTLWRAKDGSLRGHALTIMFPDGRVVNRPANGFDELSMKLHQ